MILDQNKTYPAILGPSSSKLEAVEFQGIEFSGNEPRFKFRSSDGAIYSLKASCVSMKSVIELDLEEVS